jgi:tetratricopeptide (TPR) repeat protein
MTNHRKIVASTPANLDVDSPQDAPSSFRWIAALATLLTVATFFAYWPALHGKYLWDDNFNVVSPELRSMMGLYRIWFELGAIQQYYPLLHSAFWVEHKLWGDATLGYHLVNVLFHLVSVWLVYLILHRLKIPGALLAAAIYALQPVMVETVAWITEQKNTLSGMLYFGSMLTYLHFDVNRRRSTYAWALALFALSILAKTVTVTLPAALLVIFWWQRGTLSWRRDIVPLLPWFALSLSMGVFTACYERIYVGAQGAEFALTFTQKCLLSCRAIWFYLGKLFWPADLNFMYPRWEVNSQAAWQYLYVAGVVLLFAGAWLIHRRWRGPLAALLFFVGTLFPLLGFLNAYLFRFTFVCDHFQYLASLGIIALVAASLTCTSRRLAHIAQWSRNALALRLIGQVVCVLLLGTLATLTWQQCHIYADPEILYQSVIAKNPDCWMAYNNLGIVLFDSDQVDAAIANYQKALQIHPDYVEAQTNLGQALAKQGNFQEAIGHYHRALQIDSNSAEAHGNLGLALAQIGSREEAIQQLKMALELNPNLPDARFNLAYNLKQTDHLPEAIQQYQEILRLQPDNAQAHNNLGLLLASTGKPQQAREQYEEALRLDPQETEAYCNLATVLLALHQPQAAIDQFRQALQIDPDDFNAHYGLGNVYLAAKQLSQAVDEYEQALRINPNFAEAHSNLGAALVQTGNATTAVEHYRQAIRLKPEYLEAQANLAMALAQLNLRKEAMEAAQKAIGLARTQNKTTMADQLETWLNKYRAMQVSPNTSP